MRQPIFSNRLSAEKTKKNDYMYQTFFLPSVFFLLFENLLLDCNGKKRGTLVGKFVLLFFILLNKVCFSNKKQKIWDLF